MSGGPSAVTCVVSGKVELGKSSRARASCGMSARGGNGPNGVRRGLVKCEQISGGREWSRRHRAGARTTKCRPRCAFPNTVFPGCVARAFARCGSCTPESFLSRHFASRPRSILRPQVRASSKAATQRRRVASTQILLAGRLGDRSGWAWGFSLIPYLANLVYTL